MWRNDPAATGALLLGHWGGTEVDPVGKFPVERGRPGGRGAECSALWTNQQPVQTPGPAAPGGWIAAVSRSAVQSADLSSARHRHFRRGAPLPRAQNLGPQGSASEEAMREEDVSAEQPEAEEETRIPHPDANARRPRGHRSAAREV